MALFLEEKKAIMLPRSCTDTVACPPEHISTMDFVPKHICVTVLIYLQLHVYINFLGEQ